MGTIRKVGMFEAKTHFSALVEEVRKGGEIEITKRGQTVAKIVPQPPTIDRSKARKAAEELIEMSKTQFLNGLTLKDLRDAGRKY